MKGRFSSWLWLFRRKSQHGGNPKKIVDFQAIAENSTDVLLQITPNESRIVYASPSASSILGWTAEEILEYQIHVIHPEDIPAIAAAAQRLRNVDVESDRFAYRIVRRDGVVRWVEGNARRIRNTLTGELGDIVVVMRDIHEHKLLEEKLEALALTDGLTGLANRRAFDEALEREWRRTLRNGNYLSLVLIDLDHFKSLNDQYGHQVGDDCLRAVAAVVRKSLCRPGDLCARYGGEELVVVLPETDLAGAFQIAENIRYAIENLDLPNQGNVEGGGRVTASLGVSTVVSRLGGSVRMPEALLISADSVLYKAKNNGRNRVEITILLMAQDVEDGSDQNKIS